MTTSRIRGSAGLKLIVFVAVVGAFVSLAWMIFLPGALTMHLRNRSGFDFSVDRLAINPLTGTADIRGLQVSNPPTFPEPEFLELRELKADAQVTSLFGSQRVFDRVVVDVGRVTLVKRADGTTNAAAFQTNLESGRRQSLTQPTTSRQVLIRSLQVRIDQLVVIDYAQRNPTRREFTLNINQSYSDVTEFEQLLAPAALAGLAPVATAIGDFIPGQFGRAITEAGRSGGNILRGLGRQVGDGVKGFFDALEESKKP